MQMSRDMAVMVGYGELQVGIRAEGVSWSPDVATDMVARVKTLWHDALEEAQAVGIFDWNDGLFVDDDEDDLALVDGEDGEDGE